MFPREGARRSVTDRREVRHVPPTVPRDDRADVDLVRARAGAVAKLAVERAVIADLVVLLARRNPRRRRTELERDERRARPVALLRVELANVAIIRREELLVVATR